MKFSTSLSLFLLVMCGPLTANAQVDPRVMFTPNTISVVEGVSSPITVKLAEPIICPNGTDPCDVVLTFAYPVAGVTFNPSSLSWSNATWDQSQTFTVVVAAGVSSASASNNEVETLASKSELYNGYRASIYVVGGRTPARSICAPVADGSRGCTAAVVRLE